MIKLTLWDSKWKGYQKKEVSCKTPSLCLHMDTQGNGSPEGRAEVQEQHQHSVSLHFSLLLLVVSRSEHSLAFPKQGSLLHYLPELKITAPTYPHCCFCLAVVLLHGSQQSPISVKLQ